MTPDARLLIRGLHRVQPGHRGRDFTLGPIDLEIGPGETLGLAGPNGAGKSTLLAVLAGLLRADAGEIIWKTGEGERRETPASPAWRARVGLLRARETAFYPNLSARENLRFFAALAGLADREAASRGEAALETVGLAERGDEPVRHYSSGMQARLALARLLLRGAELLLLDEPTRSLDAESAAGFIRLLRHGLEGRRAIWVSHGAEELERGATRILHLRDGRLAPPPAPGAWLVRARDGAAHAERAGLLWDEDAGAVRLPADADPGPALARLRECGAEVTGLERERRDD